MTSCLLEPSDRRRIMIEEALLSKEYTKSTFNHIESQLSWTEKWYLGFNYKVWKISCQYKLMVDGKLNIEPRAADIICAFTDIEHQIIKGFQSNQIEMIDPLIILHNVVGKREYEDLLEAGMSSDNAPLLFREKIQEKMVQVIA